MTSASGIAAPRPRGIGSSILAIVRGGRVEGVSAVRIEIETLGPFSLAQSIAFLSRFDPLGAGSCDDGRLRIAFTDDAGFPAGVCVSQEPHGIFAEGTTRLSEEALARHVARILSLDVDAHGLADVGRRDPAVQALLERYPGRRPVCFGTPFEAAAWAVLSQRVQMAQAAKVKHELARQLGATLVVDGERLSPFPAPSAIAELEEFPGLWPTKAGRLRELARAAMGGALDPQALRAVPAEEALAQLQALPGLGPWSAALVLVRGAGHPDVAPVSARLMGPAVARMYGRPADEIDDAALAEISEGWRPFRSWVTFLARNAADDAP